MSDIDHAASAYSKRENPGDAIDRTMAQKQLDATLALVAATEKVAEQARIANLIALMALPEAEAEDAATIGVDFLDVLYQVKKGLGL